MNKPYTVLFFLLLLFSCQIFAQTMLSSAKINGIIMAKQNNIPVEFANAGLYKKGDSLLVAGAQTDSKGRFAFDNISDGQYVVKCSFVGYLPTIPNYLYWCFLPFRKVVAKSETQ